MFARARELRQQRGDSAKRTEQRPTGRYAGIALLAVILILIAGCSSGGGGDSDGGGGSFTQLTGSGTLINSNGMSAVLRGRAHVAHWGN